MAHLRTPLCLATLLAGCVQEVHVPSWEPIDITDVRAAFDSPTATSTEALALGGDLFGVFEQNASAIAATNRAVETLRGLIDDDGEPAEPGDGGASSPSGTTAYLEISCAGPDLLNPVVDFSYGTLRIDGPRLNREVLARASVEGDLLFTFIDCVDGTIALEGNSRVYYDFEDEDAVVVDYDVAASSTDGGDPLLFDFPAVYRPDRVAYLLTTENEKTFVFAYDIDNPAMTELRAADGVFDCNSLTRICTPR